MLSKRNLKNSFLKEDDFAHRAEQVSSILGVVITFQELQKEIKNSVKLLFPNSATVNFRSSTSIQAQQLRRVLSTKEMSNFWIGEFENLSELATIEEQDYLTKNGYESLVAIPIMKDEYSGMFLLTFFNKSYEDFENAKNRLDFLEKQITVTMYRVKKISPTNTNSQNVNQILELCGSLYDQDAGQLQMKVLNYLMRNTNSETGFLLLVFKDSKEVICQVIGRKIQEDAVTFDAEENGLFETVLRTKRTMNVFPMSEKQRLEIESILNVGDDNFVVRSALTIPICRQMTDNVIVIVCLVNKRDAGQFTFNDEKVVYDCFLYTTSVLFTTIAYQRERSLKLQTEKMLAVARNIFSRMDNINELLLMIMQEARNLTQAERCSVFLVDEDSNELVAKVFDGVATSNEGHELIRLQDGTEIQQPGEIRIPKSQGIAGHVATTGLMLNIKKAYDHPLFYRGVDDETGFKTRNILCFPIRDDCGKTVGVAQLCNKVKGKFFTKLDEDVAKAFSIYCCISITHSLMYKKVEDAQHRSRLANELMTYHMKICDGDIALLATTHIPSTTIFLNNFKSFNSIPRNVKDRDTLLACVSMFDSLGLIVRWRINRRTLAKFLMMIKRNYRDPPYHNWMHAFSVAHFIYICIQNLPLDQQLSELELFALFVASLCHDIDHRGTNNSFQVQSGSVLAALYSSEGSVLERHHFSQTVCILNTEGSNVFESLAQTDYVKVLDLIRDIILATDLAHHLGIFSKIEAMSKKGYDVFDREHHNLLLCLLMTSGDLSDQTKNWRNTRSVAELIYNEFFRQGDLEKSIGNQPAEQMDRERAVVPNLQIAFLDGIVSPLYRILSALYPQTECINQTINRNRENWSHISEKVSNQQIKGNSEEIFKHKLVADDFD